MSQKRKNKYKEKKRKKEGSTILPFLPSSVGCSPVWRQFHLAIGSIDPVENFGK